jgi:hypothetical protein
LSTELEKSGFACSVFADDSQGLALKDAERNVSKSPEVPLGDFLVIALSRPDQTTKSSHALRGDILKKGPVILFFCSPVRPERNALKYFQRR